MSDRNENVKSWSYITGDIEEWLADRGGRIVHVGPDRKNRAYGIEVRIEIPEFLQYKPNGKLFPFYRVAFHELGMKFKEMAEQHDKHYVFHLDVQVDKVFFYRSNRDCNEDEE